MADPALRESALFPHVESGEGAEFRLSLVRADGSRVSVALGASECVTLAAELQSAAGTLAAIPGSQP